MSSGIDENIVEEAALEYFRQLGYKTIWGPGIAPDGDAPERGDYSEVLLRARLREALERINPQYGPDVIDKAIVALDRAESQNPLAENERVHRLIARGIPVEHRIEDGSIRTSLVWPIDFDNSENNDWVAVNQLTVIENGKNRRVPAPVVARPPVTTARAS